MFRGTEQNELDLRLFRIWLKASRAVFANVRKDIERYGIREDHFMILELLYSKGPQPVQKLCEILEIPSGSITYVVDKLEQSGHVRREPSPTDRRGYLVKLTGQGEAMFHDIFPKHAETISRNLSFIDNDEKLRLIDSLKTVGLGAKALGDGSKADEADKPAKEE